MATIHLIDAKQARAYKHFVFPALRFPLFEPEGKDLVFAAALDADEQAVGLAFGWGGANAEFELISIYVTPLLRYHGIGSRLLSAVEEGFADKGYTLGVHKYSLPVDDQGFARFLMGQGWLYPTVRQLICKGDLEGFCSTRWYRVRLPKDFALKAWQELTEAERAGIAARTAREPGWYAQDQDPFVYEIDCHEPTSVALLKDGTVVGWVLTHVRDGMDSLRWTVSFVAPELSRAGHIVHLWQEAARRQRERTTLKHLIWGVPLTHPRMLDFVRRRMGEHLLSTAYACTSVKPLGAAQAAGP